MRVFFPFSFPSVYTLSYKTLKYRMSVHVCACVLFTCNMVITAWEWWALRVLRRTSGLIWWKAGSIPLWFVFSIPSHLSSIPQHTSLLTGKRMRWKVLKSSQKKNKGQMSQMSAKKEMQSPKVWYLVRQVIENWNDFILIIYIDKMFLYNPNIKSAVTIHKIADWWH